jgi:hypothetical protein
LNAGVQVGLLHVAQSIAKLGGGGAIATRQITHGILHLLFETRDVCTHLLTIIGQPIQLLGFVSRALFSVSTGAALLTLLARLPLLALLSAKSLTQLVCLLFLFSGEAVALLRQ